MRLHPGLYVRFWLIIEYGDFTKVAKRLNYSVTGLTKILNGQRPITAQLAMKLDSEFHHYSAEMLLKAQVDYELDSLQRKILANLPNNSQRRAVCHG